MTEGPIADTTERDVGGCPVMHFELSADREAGRYWADADALREQMPVFFNTVAQGFWVVTRHDAVKQLYQDYELFSSESFVPWDPEPAYRFVPTQIDPPLHVKYRQILNPRFSPTAVSEADEDVRTIARRLVEAVAPRGECDFVAEFAIRFPTEVFLSVIGLPTVDADQLVPWVEDFFAGLNGAEDKLPGMAAALDAIRNYFVDVLTDRRANPSAEPRDLVSYLLRAQLDGRPLTDTELLDICTVLVLAGLDTTRGQLGYLFQHLAEHDDDRQRILADPVLIPAAVEESLRLHTIILHDARKVTRDAEFHGCPLSRGDMVMGLVSAANRDPRHYDRANTYDMDRVGAHHLGFAAGPHRCLGAHLARRELQIAVEEWHRRIPHYRIATDEMLVERGGQLTLVSLPLAWDTGRAAASDGTSDVRS